MSTLARSVMRVNLAPTVSQFSRGVLKHPSVNFAAKAPHDAHSHHGPASARSDVAPSWVTEVKLRNGFNGLVSKSHVTASPTVSGSFRHIHASRAVQEAPEVPDYFAYEASSRSNTRALSYVFVDSMGVASASLAKSTVTGFLSSMAASADVLALTKAEVDTANIHEDASGHARAALDLCRLRYFPPLLFEIRPDRRERYY